MLRVSLLTGVPGSGVDPVHASTAFSSSCIVFISLMNARLTLSNMSDSCGSCFRISSDPTKMFSRYIQAVCTLSTRSTISDTSISFCSQLVMVDSNTTKNLLAFIVDSVTMLSSSAAKRSSVDRSLKTSRPSLARVMSSESPPHVSLMDNREFSMASSLVALVDISAMNSS